MRRRRSLIWINPLISGKLQKAIESQVDSIVLDLEDTVDYEQKDLARSVVTKALETMDFRGKEKVVRINDLNSKYARKDLEAILPVLPDTIRLPKCETKEYVLELDNILTKFESRNNLNKNQIGIILMIETAKGIINVYEMASSSKRIKAIGIGLEDLTTSLQIMRKYELDAIEFLYAKQKVVIAGRAAGVQVLDSCVLINDLDFLYKDSLNSKHLGFDGRSALEISHIDIINKAYAPSKGDINWAKGILRAYNESDKSQKNELRFKGMLVDQPVLNKAKNILAKCKDC